MSFQTLCIYFFILLASNLISQNESVRPVEFYFAKNTLNITNSKAQLDSLIILADSLVKKFGIIKVVPVTQKGELTKDKNLSVKRAQLIINLVSNRMKNKNYRFYISALPFEEENKSLAHSSFISLEPYVQPLVNKNKGNDKEDEEY